MWNNNDKPIAFSVFDNWLHLHKYAWNCNRKEAWQTFVKEVKSLGVDNVFKCKDYNELNKKLGLAYVDEDGWTVDGPFRIKEFKIGDATWMTVNKEESKTD